MQSIIRTLVCFGCLIVGSAVSCFAKEWRGITPLHSTHADVIKLLGKPFHLEWGHRDYFKVDDGTVAFEWIDPTCERKYPIDPETAIRPDDLVLNISIYLKKPTPTKELGLPAGKFYFMDCLGSSASGPWLSCIFWDSEEGFGYTTGKNLVTSLSYYPGEKDFKAWTQNHATCVSSRGERSKLLDEDP